MLECLKLFVIENMGILDWSGNTILLFWDISTKEICWWHVYPRENYSGWGISRLVKCLRCLSTFIHLQRTCYPKTHTTKNFANIGDSSLKRALKTTSKNERFHTNYECTSYAQNWNTAKNPDDAQNSTLDVWTMGNVPDLTKICASRHEGRAITVTTISEEGWRVGVLLGYYNDY